MVNSAIPAVTCSYSAGGGLKVREASSSCHERLVFDKMLRLVQAVFHTVAGHSEVGWLAVEPVAFVAQCDASLFTCYSL